MARVIRRRAGRGLVAGISVVGLVAGACTSDGPSLVAPDADEAREVELGEVLLASLTRTESCGEVETLLRSSATAALERGLIGFEGFVGGPSASFFSDRDVLEAADGEDGESAATSAEARASAPAELSLTDDAAVGGADLFSTTNIQESGVDEPDRVKTDGETIAVLHNNVVHLLDADTLGERAQIEVSGTSFNMWSDSLLLDGDRLVVIGGSDDDPAAEDSSSGSTLRAPHRQRTVMVRYDISDVEAPSLVDRTVVDGHFVSARMIDGVVRLVTLDGGTAGIPVPQPLIGGLGPDDAKAAVVQAIGEASAEDLLPRFAVVDDEGSVTDQGSAVPCDAVFAPTYETGPSMLTVHSLDVDGGYRPTEAVSVLAGGETVYSSSSTLYVATSNWTGGFVAFAGTASVADVAVDPVSRPAVGTATAGSEGSDGAIGATEPAGSDPGEPVPDVEVIELEPPPPDDVDPPSDVDVIVEPPGGSPPPPVLPDEPVEPVEPNPEELPRVTTEIHSFDIAGAGAATYEGSGQVRGTVLNQFSMSEHEGVLRVATTDDGFGRTASESFVTTLRQAGDELVQVGQVGGLGRGERIFAVRFLGDVGYVVTFRQVDPLYTVDLSDPAAPTVRGELKIEGYSAYLHPTDPGRLLGLGQDATTEGRRLGTQMSLFDVSRLDSPDRLSQIGFGQGSDSSAEYDHHAFLYWAPRNLVVVPLQVFDEAARSGRQGPWAGAVLVRIDGDDLTEIGRVSHGPEVVTDNSELAFEYGWLAAIDRSLVIGDRLVTISQLGVGSVDLDSLERVAFHQFDDSVPKDLPFEGAPGELVDPVG